MCSSDLRNEYKSRYQHIFYGYCYSCGKFGHKAVECHTYPRNQYNSRRSVKYEPPSAQQNIIRFENLRNNMECYKCQNFGHIARDCRLENPLEESSKPQNARRRRTIIFLSLSRLKSTNMCGMLIAVAQRI